MSEPQWERIQNGGRERWNLVEWVPYRYSQGTDKYRHVIGYIIKTKNKHKCKDWLVRYAEVRHADLHPITLATLKQLSAVEAKAVARMLLIAQRSEV